MAEIIPIEKFLSLSSSFPVIDVRSPAEFRQAHIPGAVNLPLFNDEERRIVGTKYKKENRESALYAGLQFAGRKLKDLAKAGIKTAGMQKTLLLHCWRGGMRSASMAWLFDTMGISSYVLEGGYRSFRRFIRKELGNPIHLIVLGGKTGSGKTDLLKQLEQKGEQVIDLEGIAHHKGSAFGSLGEQEQPTTEQFENDLWQVVSGLDTGRRIWIEDESRNIGRCVLPDEFYLQMKQAGIIFLDIPSEPRAHYLVQQYAGFDQEELIGSVEKIWKKLGGDRTEEAIKSIREKDYYRTAMITLEYYDKAYLYSLQKNHIQPQTLTSDQVNPDLNSELILSSVNSKL